MSPLLLSCIIALIILLLPLPFFPLVIGYILWRILLVRTKPEKWARDCPEDDPELQKMLAIGKKWREANLDRMQETHIVHDGLNLYGEFYDFGSRETVIILPGRSDSLCYTRFWADAYTGTGRNIFLYDPRAHGKSDGKYSTVGFEEHKELRAWIDHLRAHHHTESVILHGICVGCSSGIFMQTGDDPSPIVRGMVAEGVYSTFHESCKNHMIEQKRAHWLIMPFIGMWFRLFTGHSIRRGPVDVIQQLKTPLLMLHSREDPYSLPPTAQQMYDAAGSENKKLIWFPKGGHSRLRLVDPQGYDKAIRDFLETL